AVFELLTIQGKYREAFALADKIDQVAVQVRKARTLYVLGVRDQAMQVFAALGDKIEKAKDPAEYAALVDVEYKLDLKDLAFAHAARVLARGTKERAQTSVLYHIFPKDFVSAFRWEKYFRD